MQYSIILSLLAATSSLAAPTNHHQTNNEVLVVLSGPSEAAAQVTLQEGIRDTKVPAGGPFDTVELQLGDSVRDQDLRCQLLDDAGQPIVLLRGQNTDITFADGGKGPWAFRGSHAARTVSQVICDPAFQAIGGGATELRVALANQAIELGSQTVFTDAGQRQEQPPVGSRGPFATVELIVGELVEKQDSRCQVLDLAGQPLVVLRGQNRDVTFADGDAGEWTFEAGPSWVGKVVCDPAFVKGSA